MSDERKHELMRVLKNLVFLAEKDKEINRYLKLKNVYNKMLREIFIEGDKEEFEWDNARNALDKFYTYYNLERSSKDEKKLMFYKKEKLDSLNEAKERMKALMRFLK